MDVAGHDLGAAAFVPIPVGPVLELELPVDNRHAALGKISGHEVGGVALGHDVDKIRGLVAVGVLVIPFAGNGEGRDRDAGLCTAELRVAHEAAHSDDVVQHSFFLHLRLLNIFHLILSIEPAQCLNGVGKKHEDIHLVFLRGLPRFVRVVPQLLEKFDRVEHLAVFLIRHGLQVNKSLDVAKELRHDAEVD